MKQAGARQVCTAVLNDGRRTALAAHVLLLLQTEAASRRASGLDYDRDELVVVVCAAIRRVVGLFMIVMNSLLSD